MKLNFSLKRKKGKNADPDLDADADVDAEEEVAEETPKEKAKAKSSDSNAQQFFVDHGEKIVIAVVILLSGWMVYSSVGTLRVTKGHTPEKLSDQVNAVRRKMETNEPELVESSDLAGDLDTARVAIDPSFYLMDPWNIDLVPLKKRGTPELLPIVEVVAATDIPLYYVKEMRFDGRQGSQPELSEDEAERLQKYFETIEKRQEKKREEITRREENKIKNWHRSELKEIRRQHSDDADRRKEKEQELKAEREKREAALKADYLNVTSPQTLDLPAQARLQGVQLPKPDEKKRRRDEEESEVLVEARPFVVVKGLLPLVEQQSIYNQTFAAAHHFRSERDRPLYMEAQLLRLAVPDNADVTKLDWKQATELKFSDVRYMNNKGRSKRRGNWEINTWVVQAKEVVDSRFIHDDTPRHAKFGGVLTKSLGPRIYESWSTGGIASHPEVPLARKQSTEPKKEEEASSPRPVSPAQRPKDEEVVENDIFDEDEGEAEAAPAEVVEDEPQEQPEAAAEEEVDTTEALYRLVRIFDYSVEPGKRYSYRVRVAVRNPNSDAFDDISDENVEDLESRSKKWLTTKLSDPTVPVRVPTGEDVVGDGILEEIPSIREMELDVIVRVIDLGSNDLRQMRMKLPRGGIATGRGAVYSIDPVAREFERAPRTELYTSLTLIDMRGDYDIPLSSKSQGRVPTECLFMDEQGNIFQGDSFAARHKLALFKSLEDEFRRDAEAAGEEGDEDEDGFGDGGEDDEDDFDALFGDS